MLDNGGRRIMPDRRQFLYSFHFPERRSENDRRDEGDRRNEKRYADRLD